MRLDDIKHEIISMQKEAPNDLQINLEIFDDLYYLLTFCGNKEYIIKYLKKKIEYQDCIIDEVKDKIFSIKDVKKTQLSRYFVNESWASRSLKSTRQRGSDCAPATLRPPRSAHSASIGSQNGSTALKHPGCEVDELENDIFRLEISLRFARCGRDFFQKCFALFVAEQQ